MARVFPVTQRELGDWQRMRGALWPDQPQEHLDAEAVAFLAGRLHMPALVLVAVDAAGTCGFAEVSIRPYAEGCETERVGYLEGWYVEPRARRIGVGRALVRAALDWARGQGCTEFASDALLENDVSAAAHLALGFREVERIRCFAMRLNATGSDGAP